MAATCFRWGEEDDDAMKGTKLTCGLHLSVIKHYSIDLESSWAVLGLTGPKEIE